MKVALGVSGGIACYKSAEILRRLQDRGVDVVVLMTKGAKQFVTPLTFRALSGNKVYVDIFEGERSGSDFEGAFDHIQRYRRKPCYPTALGMSAESQTALHSSSSGP